MVTPGARGSKGGCGCGGAGFFHHALHSPLAVMPRGVTLRVLTKRSLRKRELVSQGRSERWRGESGGWRLWAPYAAVCYPRCSRRRRCRCRRLLHRRIIITRTTTAHNDGHSFSIPWQRPLHLRCCCRCCWLGVLHLGSLRHPDDGIPPKIPRGEYLGVDLQQPPRHSHGLGVEPLLSAAAYSIILQRADEPHLRQRSLPPSQAFVGSFALATVHG
mmetsp:Transcript_15915/g.39104  ORF Transcript_15915/g.39104 Transcript_15915/m.39104 type:complete len:216 (+) Transcript_15915:1165-1812(+)